MLRHDMMLCKKTRQHLVLEQVQALGFAEHLQEADATRSGFQRACGLCLCCDHAECKLTSPPSLLLILLMSFIRTGPVAAHVTEACAPLLARAMSSYSGNVGCTTPFLAVQLFAAL